MSTDRYADFAPAPDTEPTHPQSLILPPGYITALDPTTGQLVALRTQEQPLPTAPAPQPVPEPSLLDKAQRYAAAQPDPIPAAAPPAWQGVSPLVGQAVVLGGITSMGMLAAGGAIYLAGGGLQLAGPWFHDGAEFLGYAALFLAVAAAVTVAAARKLKSKMTARPAGSEGAPIVNALFHKQVEVNIGKQSAGFFKGTVNNNVR
ncbi:hypothetical protein P3T36_006350 [Kitasatospora sp. MAP12-15]|uniref:hypothetical protein n=1 Tax=unclassified Kitasatospora TaxID=2633591 RepID=UPI0024732DCF|nr:hypothetical protein [Kitasatospora sp. MAP12-44]MDH6107891.1 hypothetical protein [Kitasatospora sp. MAP12-44]